MYSVDISREKSNRTVTSACLSLSLSLPLQLTMSPSLSMETPTPSPCITSPTAATSPTLTSPPPSRETRISVSSTGSLPSPNVPPPPSACWLSLNWWAGLRISCRPTRRPSDASRRPSRHTAGGPSAAGFPSPSAPLRFPSRHPEGTAGARRMFTQRPLQEGWDTVNFAPPHRALVR